MQYSLVASAVLAFTSSVFAQTAGFAAVTSPAQDQQVAAGSVLEITWLPTAGQNNGPITIELLQGVTPSTLELGLTVATGIDQATGKFAWNVPTNLESHPTYGFKITLDSTKASANPVFQFSFPFHITGLAAAPASSAAPKPSYPAGGYPVAPPPTSSIPSATPTYSPHPVSTPDNCTTDNPPQQVSNLPQPTPSTSAPPSYPTYPVNNGTKYNPVNPSGTGPVGGKPSGPVVIANGASSIVCGGFAVALGMVVAFAL